ncbi:MAG TPA: hypothetical protein DEB18_08425 [Leeuwenhoekiella sp.]|nr:hypothetical protein [Leeuwenhoekiella sp.]HBT09511.1 hypothetical protein [Leeuwenhoekiella sp.]
MVQLFQVTPSCLYRWRRKKVLPFLKVSYTVYYIKDEIDAFVRHRSRMLGSKHLKALRATGCLLGVLF